MISIVRGDTVSIPVSVPADAFTTLVGATVFFTVKRQGDVVSDDVTDSAAVIKKSLALASNVHEWTFALTSVDTNITPGTYVCDIQVKTAGGIVTTLNLSDNWFVVTADVTRGVA